MHTFPKIIKVAVPAPQHSPIFGQFPLSQMVCNWYWSTKPLTLRYSGPVGNLTLNQEGLRGLSVVAMALDESIIVDE